MHSNLTSFSDAIRQSIHDGLERSTPERPASLVLDFGELALSLYRLQFQSNEPYRRLCGARGFDESNIKNWWEIPAVGTAAFKEFDFSCLPLDNRTRLFESSGTTRDKRSRHIHSNASLAVYETSLLPWFQRHLLPETVEADPPPDLIAPRALISLTPPAKQAPTSSLVHMLDAVARQGWFDLTRSFGNVEQGAWTLDHAGAIRALQEFADKNAAVLITGTAFNFVHLLEELRRRKLSPSLPAGSRVMETGGYKGRSRFLAKDELHAWISESLGISPACVVTEYGMTELSSQAYDRVAGHDTASGDFQFPPWVRTQVISSESGQAAAPGEVGLLKVFDLANVWSVMAVETEDLAVQSKDGLTLVGRHTQAEPRGCSLMAV